MTDNEVALKLAELLINNELSAKASNIIIDAYVRLNDTGNTIRR